MKVDKSGISIGCRHRPAHSKAARSGLQLGSSLGQFASSQLSILRAYLVVTTGLYALGVALTLFPVTDEAQLANPTGGIIAIVLGALALAWLTHHPDRTTPATVAACAATPIVIAFHVLATAQLLCLVAVVFLGMYVRVSYPRRLGRALVCGLTISSIVALAISPASPSPIIYVIVVLVIPAAAETFGRMTRSLVVATCTDPLTGAFNRSGWQFATTTLLSSKRANGATVTVIAVDVDDFKSFNDTYGHLAGDQFLVRLVDRMLCVLPRTAILARTGGDEFAVCVLDNAVEEWRTELRRAAPGTTLGTANAPAETADIHDLLARADADLIRRKRRDKR